MVKLDVIDSGKKVVESIEVSDALFAAEIKGPVVHQVVIAQLAARRSGTHATKGRSEVRGGGKKPWKQKGTGRARAGSIRSPLWRGGGTTFGPQPRDYTQDVNKKMRRVALTSMLSSIVNDGRLVIVDSLAMDEIKTKTAKELISKIDTRSPMLIIYTDGCENFVKSSANIPSLRAIKPEGLNAYDLACADVIIATKDAIKAIEERLSK